MPYARRRTQGVNSQPSTTNKNYAMIKTTIALISTCLALLCANARAETPQEFANRMKGQSGLQLTVNMRENGSFGSISIRLPPKLVADKSELDPVLAEIGKFAAAMKLQADVLTPSQADSAYVADKLKLAGIGRVVPKVMAEGVSNKTSRIFLLPEQSEAKK